MKTKTDRILVLMKFLFWLVFIGFSIKTGALITSFIISLFFNSNAADDLYLGLNLAELHQNHFIHYICLTLLIILLSTLKTYIVFLATKIFTKINFNTPFNNITANLLLRISYAALTTGIIALFAYGYNFWIIRSHASMINTIPFVDGSREFLLLAGIIFVIAQIFKKGVTIQTENELTI